MRASADNPQKCRDHSEKWERVGADAAVPGTTVGYAKNKRLITRVPPLHLFRVTARRKSSPKAHATSPRAVPMPPRLPEQRSSWPIRMIGLRGAYIAFFCVAYWALNVFDNESRPVPRPDRSRDPVMALESAQDKQDKGSYFAMLGSRNGSPIFYVSKGRRYHVTSCFPCGFRYTICPSDPSDRIKIPLTEMGPADAARVMALPEGPHFQCTMTPEYNNDRGFVSSYGRIMFVEGGVKHHVVSCRPCGPGLTVCPPRKGEKAIPVRRLDSTEVAIVTNFAEGEQFRCSMTPEYFEGYSMWQRRPLNLRVTDQEPRRLNVVLNGLSRSLTGGPLSILRFMNAVLKHTDISVRLILIDGEGLEEDDFRMHIAKYPALELLRESCLYVFDALRPGLTITANPGDLFMATVYYTAFTCHATLRAHPALRNRNFVYFIQDFEPIFFAQNTGYVTALETYRYPHFGIYSTPFLQRWFRERRYGQYAHMTAEAAEPAYSFGAEPAIKPWGIPSQEELGDPTRKRKVIVYARKHADRNAYELTINALSQAACHRVFAENWEFIGMGAPDDYTEHLGMPCGKKIEMRIRKNVPENEYRQLVQTGDVGLSLMISPHPSLPPFDLVAAGLVTVTNSFGTKTAPLLEAVSKNFVVVEPYLSGVVRGLVKAAKRSQDVPKRLENAADMNWEKEWSGDRCYGPPLMKLVRDWFGAQEPLWPYDKDVE